MDYILQATYGDVELDEDPVIVPSCRHLMGMSEYYELSPVAEDVMFKFVKLSSDQSTLLQSPIRSWILNFTKFKGADAAVLQEFSSDELMELRGGGPRALPKLPREWDQFLTMFNEGTEDDLKRRFRQLLDGELAPSDMPQQDQNNCEDAIKNWQSFCAWPGSRDEWTEQTWIEEIYVTTFDRVFRSTLLLVIC